MEEQVKNWNLLEETFQLLVKLIDLRRAGNKSNKLNRLIQRVTNRCKRRQNNYDYGKQRI
jgi:hypothetical protein